MAKAVKSETKSKKTKENKVSAIRHNDTYSKGNLLITAKYRSSLLENKLLAIALANIQNSYEDDNGNLISELKASEIKKLMGDSSNSIYRHLEPIAQQMTGRTIGMKDPEREIFDYKSVVTHAHYENGTFTIEFNHLLKDQIIDIQNKYTVLNLPTMLLFKSVYSFRLYELLKSMSYIPKGQKRNDEDKNWELKFQLSELKLELGVVNANSDRVQKILSNKKHPNFDEAVKAAPEQVFEQYRDFKRRVLDVAVAEINEKTEINVEYETLKSGRGGKVNAIIFYVSYDNVAQKEEIVKTEEVVEKPMDIDELLDEIYDILEGNFKLKDVRKIAKEADYNLASIKKAYKVYKKNEDNVENSVGFMIAAIKDGYESTAKKKKTKAKNTFVEFDQNEYDFDDLEGQLIDN
ncbi:MAG: replication initiation protein [Butyrivibrio sp.]|nr:replication initiation protein [Butyrivibrio sp.]